MKLVDVLSLPVLEGTRVVAGESGLERDVRWVHITDLPDFLPWVRPGQLLLTTGYAWPREEADERAIVRALAEHGLAGVCLAVPHFFEHFSEAAREEADAAQLPLLEIPWDIPFARITEDVHRAILAEQYRVIEHSEAIHRALTRAALQAGSLQDLARTLSSLIQRTIAFVDESACVLATAAYESQEPGVVKTLPALEQSLPGYIGYLEKQGYLQKLRTRNESLHIPAAPEVGLVSCIICPIRPKGELVGFVWITEGEQELSELDVRAAEHAAMVAALHITHQRELVSLETRFGYTFLDSLLEGRFEATPQALERAQLLGFSPDSKYRVGLVVLDEPTPLSREGFLRRERLVVQLRQRLRVLDTAPLLTVTLNQIIFLLPERHAGQRIWDVLKGKGISLAFGLPYAGIEGVRRSYREVLSLLPYIPAEKFCYYETLLLPRVLVGDQDAKQAFLDMLLGRLKEQRNGDVLCETLLTWAQTGFHSTMVAERMGVHPKTLQYRLSRASDITRLDLADPETRFRLQLAVHLLSLQDKKTL
ncbi:transcriptional regulator [Ktedonobacter sp. SOSP1-85]|uniref:PucR family transcriptional regulator n=1 Tax=Ktedonobacter sp. SOSP1-85 TaxID=2778367 RepID=UPI001916483D|nr:PucR family transcriptional regulator [Ktedonobacter sp. SOSP1-85]GHO81485.1 transcriptional regulator [Ktedonobacter sp. SOSP1-85]